jgi:hypothetical protein
MIPASAAPRGRYLPEEWTIYAQVGHEVAGCTLTIEEYSRIEAAYVKVAMSFLAECGVDALTIHGVMHSCLESLDTLM